MIKSILRIQVSSPLAEEVIDRYAKLEVLETSILESGALACELAQSTTDEGSLIVSALWKDEAAYAHWLANPSRERIAAAMGDLTMLMTGETYRVRASVSAPTD
ncbi:quinol monooxygenase YgiN [Mycolicibacterium mucogenicum 261Sha1.1M5]|nr:quinol monooxygenase YgiN [Mycolicibacterium mucogenicum 261Sha1.1M5]